MVSPLSSSSISELTGGAGRQKRTSSPKYTECWAADKPFAKISEKRLAKTIGMAVS